VGEKRRLIGQHLVELRLVGQDALLVRDDRGLVGKQLVQLCLVFQDRRLVGEDFVLIDEHFVGRHGAVPFMMEEEVVHGIKAWRKDYGVARGTGTRDLRTENWLNGTVRYWNLEVSSRGGCSGGEERWIGSQERPPAVWKSAPAAGRTGAVATSPHCSGVGDMLGAGAMG